MKIVKIILACIGIYIAYYIIGFIYFLVSFSPGTLGGFKTTRFEINKYKLESVVDSLFFNNFDSTFKVPQKWKVLDTWEKDGYGFLDTRIYYFSSPPEEMYYVSFIGDSSYWKKHNYSEIAIRSIGNKHGWKSEKSIDDDDEIERIEKRFKKEIITLIEQSIKN